MTSFELRVLTKIDVVGVFACSNFRSVVEVVKVSELHSKFNLASEEFLSKSFPEIKVKQFLSFILKALLVPFSLLSTFDIVMKVGLIMTFSSSFPVNVG